MSAESVGRHMPSVITLDDLTAKMAEDEHHRYEISPEGVLSVTPPFGSVAALRSEGVRVLTGPADGWEPHPPGTGSRQQQVFPWQAAFEIVRSLAGR